MPIPRGKVYIKMSEQEHFAKMIKARIPLQRSVSSKTDVLRIGVTQSKILYDYFYMIYPPVAQYAVYLLRIDLTDKRARNFSH